MATHLQVVLGNEVADSEFALHHHGERGRLHAADGEVLAVGERVGAGEVHADQPVGAAAAAGGVGEAVVVAAGAERVEAFADGVGGERGDPQAAHRLGALRGFVDVAEDELALAAGVRGADDAGDFGRVEDACGRSRTGPWSSRRPPAAIRWGAWAAGRGASAATAG